MSYALPAPAPSSASDFSQSGFSYLALPKYAPHSPHSGGSFFFWVMPILFRLYFGAARSCFIPLLSSHGLVWTSINSLLLSSRSIYLYVSYNKYVCNRLHMYLYSTLTANSHLPHLKVFIGNMPSSDAHILTYSKYKVVSKSLNFLACTNYRVRFANGTFL